MNTIITSREAILKASQKLALETGLQSINIRGVAASCNVSIGSVYNYFPSKADLMTATIEKVWKDIFHKANQHRPPEGFVECVVWLYNSIQNGLTEHPTFFALHSRSFAAEDKEKGRIAMDYYFTHMKKGLLQALSNDPKVRPDAFTQSFTQADFVDFIFISVINMSTSQSKNCYTLTEIIKRSIF
ncbi:MAG: TetR/AcrR family transcriptional regulator [Anaerovoracaceae bacterium]